MNELRKEHSTRLVAFLACLAFLSGCASAPISPATPSRAYRPRVPSQPLRTIVLDPGHGGRDPGTQHFGLREKHLTLDIARRVRAELEQAGLQVVMTRDADRFIGLSSRPAIASRNEAGLFVSIHINANRSGSVSGAEVYYARESTAASRTRWPPFLSPTEVATSSPTVRHVLWDMVLRRSRSHSRSLASSVCGHLRQDLGVSCRVKSARFVVLRESQMPAVLVEVGYVSNQTEARRLSTAEYRNAAARAIARGILAYVRRQGTG